MISQFLDFIHRKVVDAIRFHYNLEEAICLFFFACFNIFLFLSGFSLVP